MGNGVQANELRQKFHKAMILEEDKDDTEFLQLADEVKELLASESPGAESDLEEPDKDD